jgi:hypothetical protein
VFGTSFSLLRNQQNLNTKKNTSTSLSTTEQVEINNELEQEADKIVISEEQKVPKELSDSLQSDGYANSPSSKQQKKELFSFLPQHLESHTHCLIFY